MRWADKLLLRVRSLFERPRVEQELDDELRFHLEQQIEENIARGMTREEARYSARRSIGGIEQIREECRDMRGVTFIETLLQDLRYALRMMRRSAGFTMVAVLSLALGIGANTAIFSLADAILLKKLPVNDPDRLVTIERSVNYPFFRELDRRNGVLGALAGRFSTDLNLTAEGSTERIHGELVSGSYFRVLGVGAALGRVLTEEDDGAEDAHPVCVISYDLWQKKFGGAPDVLNKSILLNARPFQIVGVSERGFRGAALQGRSDMQVPMSMTEVIEGDKRDSTGWSWLQMIGRLRPGIARAQAEANIQAIATNIDKEQGHEKWKASYRLFPGDQGFDDHRDEFKKPILVLLALVGSVLLIACANVANLLLARAVERHREIAVRLALGATRVRLVRQLLLESLVLSGVGGTTGFLLSFWMGRALVYFLRNDNFAIEVHPDLLALVFTAGLSVITGLLFGLMPAWQLTRPDVAPALKQERAGPGWVSRALLRRALVMGQISVSLVLVFGAGLFARTLRNLRTVDLGFRPEQIILMTMDPSLSSYKEAATALLYDRLLERIRKLPGVRAASLANMTVLSGGMFAADVRVTGYTPQDHEPNDYLNWVSPDYFKTLGTPILQGRDFNRWDRKGTQPVAIVNQRFASHFWPGQNAIGKRFRWGGWKSDVEIVGLVANTKYRTIREEPQFIYYLPVAQQHASGLTLYARTAGDSSQMISSVRDIVHSLDPKLPVYNIKTLEAQIDAQLSQERILASLSTFFSATATILAAIGLYGVVAYSIKRRYQEIGIRMALGARGNDVVLLFVRESLATVLLGIGIGIACTFASAKYCASLLYGLHYNDGTTLVVASVLLLMVALLAAFLPARRASRVDPMIALRYE
jgi:predicted permease